MCGVLTGIDVGVLHSPMFPRNRMGSTNLRGRRTFRISDSLPVPDWRMYEEGAANYEALSSNY
jgi:hypothetical protein